MNIAEIENEVLRDKLSAIKKICKAGLPGDEAVKKIIDELNG